MFEHLSEEEWREMHERWDAGRMRGFVALLPSFIARHRDEILSLARNPKDPEDIITAVKMVMIDRGSLDFRDEMKTQTKKIRDHVWISRERADRDPKTLEEEWIAHYAVRWRVWRMKKYVFVANRCADEVVAMVLQPPAGNGAAPNG